jgi:hypothetical protein
MDRANNTALLTLSKVWLLDGDWMKCRACKQVLIASLDGEPLHHKTGCKHAAHAHPWAELRSAMSLPSGSLREALEKHDAFIQELTQDFIGSFDGAELQEMLVRHGLYRIEPFDPAIHNDHSGAAEPGDDFYVPTGIARAVLSSTGGDRAERSVPHQGGGE